jgi:biotin transport system substrate-specific component
MTPAASRSGNEEGIEMTNSATQIVVKQDRVLEGIRQASIVIGATIFIALCARVTLPLPFTPVPLTLQNFAVLLVGMLLGWRRGFAALALYLAEGASGLPVFNPAGPGGIAQLLGPTGGYLLAYPFVAAVAGCIAEAGQRTFARLLAAGFAAELVLFAGGIGWLAMLTHSMAQAVQFGLYWFIFAEVIKVMMAAAIASGWSRARRFRQ